MKYGYDSPDSFTKAFTRFHGVTPAAVRKDRVMPMPDALQDVNAKIFAEWLPALKEYEFAAGYCVEYYDDPKKYAEGTLDSNYYCEIWILVKKKFQKENTK